MSLEGKYMIAFTKNMNVEAREGPGSKVEHEMEFTITGPGVIEGTLTGRGGGSRAFTGTLVDNRFEFTVQGGHGPQSGAPAGAPPKPFFMTYAGEIAEDGTVTGTMTCTGRYDEPTVDPLTGYKM